jgi:polyphosphate kinase
MMMQIEKVQNLPFRSKEVSWLAFNSRVLQEAEDASVPLLERLRFLGIYSSNMDEFFRVRVATLKRLAALGPKVTQLKLPEPRQTLKLVKKHVKDELAHFDRIYVHVLKQLRRHGIHFVDETKVPAELKPWVLNYYHTQVQPHIMPTMIRSYSRLNVLRDFPLYLAVKMTVHGKHLERPGYALIEIPTPSLGRFVVLPEHQGSTLVMYLDDIIRIGLPQLFAGLPYNRFQAWAVKFTRDAEMEFDDDITESLYDKISEGLKAREAGAAVRMNYDKDLPKDFLKLLLTKLKLKEEDTLFPGARYHNRKDLMRLPSLGGPELRAAPPPAVPHPAMRRSERSLFKLLHRQEVLLHFPYHSFDNFLNLLREASLDPMVQHIRLTQYRVARDSCVAKALVSAVRNGKSVTVLVEPRARFDEQNNIAWASHYQDAGIRVILGVPLLKVHAKLCLITRTEGSRETHYAAIGTGNFNEDTARFYTDHMLLTADTHLCKDVAEAFRFFENMYRPPRFTYLAASPFNLRQTVRYWIENEIKMAEMGREAAIFIKLNNLSDVGIVELLYKAAEAGVKIRILCRSMFSVITGDGRHPSNIEARGIVDQYLEHSRILAFHNGGQPRYFFSSADFLPRNFEGRFEILCPVFNKKLQRELERYLRIQWADNQKSRVLDRMLTNAKHSENAKTHPVRAQQAIAEWLGTGRFPLE